MNYTDIKPSQDRLLVEKIDEDTKSNGGIILSPSAINNQNIIRCKVLKVGDGLRDQNGNYIKMLSQEGDILLVYKLNLLKIDGSPDNNQYLIREQEVLAKVLI